MTATKNHDHHEQEDPSAVEYKLHVSRVPTSWEASNVQRVLQEHLPSTSDNADSDEMVVSVELIYPKPQEQEEDHNNNKNAAVDSNNSIHKKNEEHRGFGFVKFASQQVLDQALQLGTIRGGRTPNASKRHTLYLRPYAETEEDAKVCYLWSQHRCPYGDECKFTHDGPGGCVDVSNKNRKTKKKGKCFAYKKGKCTKGDDCPFSHDFEVVVSNQPVESSLSSTTPATDKVDVPKSEKDCINWKTKGKCRKGDKCPYRHDPSVQEQAQKKLERKKYKQRKAESGGSSKEKQPLSVRVFGLNYETTEHDIRQFFDGCGTIREVTFPKFDDSGRSKGYCGVWFCSPKAVQKAIELDGQELHGRWLRIQAGKMYLKQWEQLHPHSSSQNKDDDHEPLQKRQRLTKQEN